MSGQPTELSVALVVSAEIKPTSGGSTVYAPSTVIQAGNSLKLKAFFRCDLAGDPFHIDAVVAALETAATGEVRYFFDDLISGGIPVNVQGGPINKVPVADVKKLTDPGGPLEGFPATDTYYLSDEVTITTGVQTDATAKLRLATGAQSGVWRVLTYLQGGIKSNVSAFDDDLLIQVIA